MPKKSACLKVPKRQGEKTLILANKLQIINKKLEIQRDENFIHVPLTAQPSEEELITLKKQIADCRVSTHVFSERKKKETSLAELLEDQLPLHLLASLPHAADFIGNIAIIEITPELDAYKKTIGQAILKANKNTRTVLAKAGAISGTYRLREFIVIAGENKTETIHKEYGCQYYVDIAKAYFSPRLSYEHHRVASLVKDGETIVDLFAGVGPFAVQIAKTRGNVKVYAIDVNPNAVEFLMKNIRLNRVEGKIHPISGDAKQVVKDRLSGVADRVIMNLPEKAMEFVDTACGALKPTGGTVHFYGFVNTSDAIENLRLQFTEAVEKCGKRVVDILFSRMVRETAPYEWQAVLDGKIR